MDLGLDGKPCLVSGASRGIGRAIAIALAREGGRVAAVARGEADLAALGRELPGGPHTMIVADVATAEGAAAAVDGCVRALGGIDVAGRERRQEVRARCPRHERRRPREVARHEPVDRGAGRAARGAAPQGARRRLDHDDRVDLGHARRAVRRATTSRRRA